MRERATFIHSPALYTARAALYLCLLYLLGRFSGDIYTGRGPIKITRENRAESVRERARRILHIEFDDRERVRDIMARLARAGSIVVRGRTRRFSDA